jgi:hypothetical protein
MKAERVYSSNSADLSTQAVSFADRGPENAGQHLSLSWIELGLMKVRLRVEKSQGKRLSSSPR